jgi:FKBP-type peptidyl-prolyl cis-trans isomerase (trigger factor)
MKVEAKKIDALKRTMRIEVIGDEYLTEKNSVFKEKAKGLKVPGFRSGTAPMDVLEKHHGALLRDAFLNKAIPEFYQNALKQENIFAVSIPKISDIEMTLEKLAFSAEFEVKPELEITDSHYKGMKIKVKEAKVIEIDIEKVITNIKEGIKKTIKKDFSDDEISRWASYPKIQDFREAIKAQLVLEKTKERRQDIDDQIKQKLLKSIKVDIPKSQLEQHQKELVNREIYNLQYRGVQAEDIEKYKEEVEKKMKTVAEEEVKLFYIFDAIAQKEGIESNNKMIDVVLGLVLSAAEYK